jgi:hypothetical protein
MRSHRPKLLIANKIGLTKQSIPLRERAEGHTEHRLPMTYLGSPSPAMGPPAGVSPPRILAPIDTHRTARPEPIMFCLNPFHPRAGTRRVPHSTLSRSVLLILL